MCRFEKVEIFLFDAFEPIFAKRLQRAMEEIVKIDVLLQGLIAKPLHAFNEARGQFWAKAFLEVLLPMVKPGSIALGITKEDLYEEGLNFVFGEASMSIPIAIVATKRLHNGFYGIAEDEELFFMRTLKECNHEIGHTLGLAHCPDPLCVMHFSNSLADTDRKNPTFCPNCWQKAKKVLCIKY